MATTEYVLDSLTEMDRYVRQMAAATKPADLVDAVSGYLASWSKDRVLNIQKIDAGWAPFDDRQQAAPVCGVTDVLQICDSVRAQCIALKDSGIPPSAELLELDLFFFFARQVVEEHEPLSTRAYASIPPGRHSSRLAAVRYENVLSN